MSDMKGNERLFRIALAALLFLAVLLAANIWLSAHSWLPAVDRSIGFLPVPELAILALVTVLLPTIRHRGVRLSVQAATALLLALLGLFSVADGVLQQVWQRGFIPQSDFHLVRGGLLLLFGRIGSAVDVLVPFTVALIAAAGLLCASCLTIGLGVLPGTVGNRARGILATPFAALLVAAVLSPLGGGSPAMALADRVRDGAASEVLTVTAEELLEGGAEPGGEANAAPGEISGSASGAARGGEAGDAGSGEGSAEAGAAAQNPTAAEQFMLPGIKDRDVVIFVLESYGYAAYNREALYRELSPTFARVERSLRDAGYRIASHYLVSPVSGGRSWMAEATFFSGQKIDRQDQYEALFESSTVTLPRFLDMNGYYTMMIRPGTVHGDWPEGRAFYSFDEMMLGWGEDFEYAGPNWSYVAVTDQFALWKAHERIERYREDPRRQPLFANFQLVSSHTPFNRIPQYLDDWSRLGDGSVYFSTDNRSFDNSWTGGSEYDEGYIAAIDYSLTVVSEYLTQIVSGEGDALYIIYGDHQPLRPVRVANARLSVPVHIVSRDPELLRPFLERGYVQGFEPTQEPPHPGMEEFFPGFVRIARGSASSLDGGEPEPAPEGGDAGG